MTKQEYNRVYSERNRERLKAYRLAKYRENRVQILASNKEWTKRNHSSRLEYWRKIAKTPRRRLQAKACWDKVSLDPIRLAARKAKAKAYAIKNAEKLRLYWKNYRKSHPLETKAHNKANWHRRRALLVSATVNLASIKEFIRKIKSKKITTCYYCEGRVSTSKIHFDHIIPLCKGGSHSVENLCVSCLECNQSKHKKKVEAWVRIGQQILAL